MITFCSEYFIHGQQGNKKGGKGIAGFLLLLLKKDSCENTADT